jgi:predicted nucleic acid-binding protein
MTPLVLDAGALIALERRSGRMLALLREVTEARVAAHVTAGVVAQVWRGSPRQHALVRLLRTQAVRVHPLTEAMAYRVGLLLAASSTSDVVDAHVALLARSLGAAVVTSDPEDLRRLDSHLRLATP